MNGVQLSFPSSLKKANGLTNILNKILTLIATRKPKNFNVRNVSFDEQLENLEHIVDRDELIGNPWNINPLTW